jgi:tetratricopeptide (TPR) repeat protein
MKSERQLLDEIRLREASLDDARRENEAGELSHDDYVAIVRRESTALDLAREDLAQISVASRTSESAPTTVTTSGVRRHPRRRLLVAIACFALAAGVLVWANLGLRQAGQSDTGGLSLSQSQKVQEYLNEGEADVANGDDIAALAAYQEVLDVAPSNVAALTEEGWLDFSAGSSVHNAAVLAHGVALLRRAVTLDKNQAAPRLYYAIVAYDTPGNRPLATAQFQVFVKLHPSTAQLDIAARYLRALRIAP